MAAKIRLELNPAGFEEILTGPEVRGDLERRGRAIARAAGRGFEASTVLLNFGGSPRTGVVVRATTARARRAQARDRVLNRALDAGRS
ncbi:hypothetical protein [Cellulosimicrobium funkei]|uniref:hypothetical protein n=1 Tax=Cellulosimicrobium funkei TaxID=264251 RepID=UPI00344508EA